MDKKQLKIDWGNLRHDPDLDKLLNPRRIGENFARKAEKALFTFMWKLGIWKVYIWDDFHSDGSTARWEWCFDYKRPKDKACRECNLAHLIAMDDWHFERLVQSLPKSSNEDIVRAWRSELRKDPMNIHAAKSEASPMDWSEFEFDPNLIKEKLL